MKIMYCKYMKMDYEEITLEELKYRTTLEYEEKTGLSVFIIVLDCIEAGVLYFSEKDAYDY